MVTRRPGGGRPAASARPGLRAWPRADLLLLALAPFGLALGLGGLVQHLEADPLVDLRVYYDAGARLNAGLPLYDPAATGPVGLYLYPPLLAILFRPLSLLPFPVVAVLWTAAMVAAGLLVLRRIGLRRRILLVLALLAMPIAWTYAIGQVEPVITLLLVAPTPFTVALAGHLKLAPFAVAVWWVARRDRRALVRLAAWVAALGVVQLVLAPQATLEYLELGWIGPALTARTISPFVDHPALWAVLAAALLAVAWRAARTPSGWAWAVALAVLAHPRLLAYQLMTLLAAFGGPRDPHDPSASAGAAPADHDQRTGSGGRRTL